ncbi:metallophosphoesterase [Oceanicola sp. 22II-s10i]|uniref:ligase-associated DNA damage response endonuclease PdeM n=1 Tax=Oceanicola sp. 22II-s10i TaxID=1317116 RepID=UPI000B521B98|nr:ligase-associated DNA damage response endonuclease PdeM [Oceanicola sp. 22II-s10i]OWU85463.1 metallophosphoesterase [Oceanicola sp. 22II-s10i]
MNTHAFTFCGAELAALGSGALWWAGERTLIVSDLHMGKSERTARRGGTQLPPYETQETLSRLDADIEATRPDQVICLGDSFDDAAAADALTEDEVLWLMRLQAGRGWVWIEGNHDPGPVGLGGQHLAELEAGPLVFRHIATPAGRAEISGHYHPKATLSARGRGITRPCFLIDGARLILPAYGAYTGGLRCTDPALATLMQPGALAILTGPTPRAIPMPR